MPSPINASSSHSISSPLRSLSGSVGVQEVKESSPSAEDNFLKVAKMTPAERMRASILSGMGITEDQLSSMPLEQQKAFEQKVAEVLKQAAEKEMEYKKGAGGFFTDMMV